MMRKHAIFRTMIFAFSLLAVAGCAQLENASNCAGWRKNDLSAAGLVALTKADRQAAERVEGNDQNGKQLGCW